MASESEAEEGECPSSVGKVGATTNHGCDDAPRAKRARVGPPGEEEGQGAAVDGAGAAGAQPTSPPPAAAAPAGGGGDDAVAAAVARIAAHIARPAKFAKAAGLLQQLLRQPGALRADAHGDAVFGALRAAMADPAASGDPALARPYARLFAAAAARAELFSAAQAAQLDVYGVWAGLRTRFTTDDSFELSRAAGDAKAAVAALPEYGGGAEGDEPLPLVIAADAPAWTEAQAAAGARAALLDCLAAARAAAARHAWAAATVDLLVEHYAAHAARFSPPQRERIRDAQRAARAAKAARQRGPSAREAARDSTAFERAREEWGAAAVSHRGKVGAGGDHKGETWLG